MSQMTVALNRLAVLSLMHARDIDCLADLARRAGVTYRRLMRSIDGQSFVKEDAARRIADALGAKSIWDLGARRKQDVLGTRSDALGPVIPRGVKYGSELQDALTCDMRGESQAAVHITEDVLAKLPPDDMPSFLVATAKLVSFLCNLGLHDDALRVYADGLDRARARGKQVANSDEAMWCDLHGAVAMRRNGDHDGAREILERLSRLPNHRWGALHQLAVIQIISARRPLIDKKLRWELLRDAQKKLERCRKAWARASDFREAYSLRRSAETHFMMAEGDEPDRHMVLAHAQLVDALQIFTVHDMHRYIAATKVSLHVLFVIKGSKLANFPPIVLDPEVRHQGEPRAGANNGRQPAASKRTRAAGKAGRRARPKKQDRAREADGGKG